MLWRWDATGAVERRPTSTRRSRSVISGEEDGEDDGRRDDDGDAVPGRRSIIMIVLVYVPCPWMVNLTSTVDRR